MIDFAALFRPLAEQGPQLYFAYHVESRRLVYVSPAYTALLGGLPENANDDLPALLARLHPDDRAYAAGCFRHLLRGGFLGDVELRFLREGAPLQWFCLSAARVSEAPGYTYLSGTVQDNSRSREYMDNVDRFNKKKNATLEILSHELAGPFVMLQQLSEHVSEKVEAMQDAKLNALLQVMRQTCEESVSLIRDFVDNEFMESANVELKRERIDLVAGLREMVQEYQRSEASLNKRFHFRAISPSAYLELDNNKFMQVVNNLISNAIKFTPDGGRIEVAVAEEPGRVLVTVADNGVGIPEHLLPVLFERFTPARRPGLRGEKTTGLGMSIIKTIVELHGGQIQCQSTEQQGTTFAIALPRAEPA